MCNERCLGSAMFLWCISPTNCSRFCAFLLSAVCEMCGIVGTREAFFSKTKRFCSVSCSRSYSSNSKKASILARLQVSRNASLFPEDVPCTQELVVAL